jgi:outer membrane protein assembly factor BamB
MKRLLGILGLSFAVPPAGWVLLVRAPWRWWTKVLTALIVLLLGIGHLVAFWGLRYEMLGSGMPHFYFPPGEKHIAEIEKRALADRLAPEPAPAPPVAAAPPPAAATLPNAVPVPAPVADASGLWPGFYGPQRDAQYRETPILTSWPAKGLVEVWRRPVGGGYASMAVAEGRVYTIEQRRGDEAAVAYDLGTGREVWAVAWKGLFEESMGGPGPRATPAWDAGRVYVLGALGEFRCLDSKTGQTLWRKNILDDNGAANVAWGMASAPLVLDNLVVVLPGGPGGKSVVAYDKLTGARVWSVLDDKAAFTAPMVATLAGVRQILVVTADRAVGLAPSDGRLLWDFPWKTEYDVNSTLPVVVGPDRLVLTAGYGHGAALLEIQSQGGKLAVAEVWKSQALKNRFNSNALRDGVIYGLDEGIMVAMDVATGQRKWKGGRYGYGQFLMAGGHIVVLTEGGEVVLVKANPEKHEELARFQAINGKTWNPPAMAGGRLLVRNGAEMACYRVAP